MAAKGKSAAAAAMRGDPRFFGRAGGRPFSPPTELPWYTKLEDFVVLPWFGGPSYTPRLIDIYLNDESVVGFD
jgi:hypothetical protein